MDVMGHIYGVKNWFDKHDIKIDPDKFEVVLRFKDIQQYAHFEYVVRTAMLNESSQPRLTSWQNEGELMGVRLIVEAPGNCMCPVCKSLRFMGWRK